MSAYILHISYDVELTPFLDFPIIEILEWNNIDCMRDDENRDIYLFYETEAEVDDAIKKLDEKGKEQLENVDDECCLLDFIRICKHKHTRYQEEKISGKQNMSKIFYETLENKEL